MASKSPWIAAEQLADSLPSSREPALAVIREAPHLVWNSRDILYHSYRGPGGWTMPVPVAMGSQPALAASPDGDLHCLFSNSFAGNFEIYHVVWHAGAWSLPINVSHTAGASTHPALAVAPDGTVMAVWMDDTAGRPVIYWGRRDPGATLWGSAPIPNSQGLNPVLSIALNGDLYAAWQDRDNDMKPYDVYCALHHGTDWALPVDISESPDGQSIAPTITGDGQGFGHLAWQEQQGSIFHIAYAQRVPGGWTTPSILSTPGTDARLPHLVSNGASFTELVWLEGNALRHCSRMPIETGYWSQPETITGNLPPVADIAVAISQTGHIHLVWSAFMMGSSLLFYSQREPLFGHTVYFPIG